MYIDKVIIIMVSISHHIMIMPPVINSLGDAHMHMHKHIRIHAYQSVWLVQPTKIVNIENFPNFGIIHMWVI